MIIVTQNKENIINFDNVNNIYIKKNDGKSECYEIKANQNCGYSIILGTYPSLERAKEVIEEIAKFYYISNDPRIKEHDLYEMPEK